MKAELASEICIAITRAVQRRKERGADIIEILRFLSRLKKVWKDQIIREFILRLAICEMMKAILEMEDRHENQSYSKRA